MAYDDAMAERVRRILATRPDVVERRMMGALVFMVNGAMCCGLSGTTLMVRVGPEAYERVLAQAHVQPMEIAGRRMRGFVRIEPGGWRTDQPLARWVQQGIDFASTLPGKKTAARRPRRKASRA